MGINYILNAYENDCKSDDHEIKKKQLKVKATDGEGWDSIIGTRNLQKETILGGIYLYFPFVYRLNSL